MTISERILAAIIVTAAALTVGTYLWKEAQNDVAARWCPAFNETFDAGRIENDKIICSMEISFPLSALATLEETQPVE